MFHRIYKNLLKIWNHINLNKEVVHNLILFTKWMKKVITLKIIRIFKIVRIFNWTNTKIKSYIKKVKNFLSNLWIPEIKFHANQVKKMIQSKTVLSNLRILLRGNNSFLFTDFSLHKKCANASIKSF